MNVLQCYLDDSSATEGAGESVALGGALGTLEGWCRVVAEWEPIIRDSGMGVFHATEWRGQEHQLKEHWRQLIESMNEHLIAYVGCVVPPHAVKTLSGLKVDRREMTEPNDPAPLVHEWAAFESDPLSICLSWCMFYLSDISRTWGGGQVSLTFAKTHRLKARSNRLSAMMNLLERTRNDFGSTTFDGDPRTLVQLQVADLVAYELTAYRRYEQVRWQFQLLRRKLKRHTADSPRFANLLAL